MNRGRTSRTLQDRFMNELHSMINEKKLIKIKHESIYAAQRERVNIHDVFASLW
jgi:hypothetical protein